MYKVVHPNDPSLSFVVVTKEEAEHYERMFEKYNIKLVIVEEK